MCSRTPEDNFPGSAESLRVPLSDDVQPVTEDRRRCELRDATTSNNHTTLSTTGLLSVYNGRRTTAIPTICVREEIETET